MLKMSFADLKKRKLKKKYFQPSYSQKTKKVYRTYPGDPSKEEYRCFVASWSRAQVYFVILRNPSNYVRFKDSFH